MNAAIAPATPATEDRVTSAPLRVPQVNLLPPDVAAAHGLRTVKRWAVLGVATSVLLVGLVYVLSAVQLGQARSELSAEQSRGSQLQGQMAQYAEVPLVLGELDQAEQARSLATSTEVLWRPYLDALRAALPTGTTIDSLQATGATPVTAAAGPTDPLQQQGMGQLMFTATSPTLPDSAAWIEAMSAVPGLVDPRIQSAVIEETETSVGYLVTGTVQYDENALSGRFQAAEGNE